MLVCFVPCPLGKVTEQPRCHPLLSWLQGTNKPAHPLVKAQSFSEGCAHYNGFLTWTGSSAISVRARKKNKKKPFLTHSALWLVEDARRKWKTPLVSVVPGTDQTLKC